VEHRPQTTCLHPTIYYAAIHCLHFPLQIYFSKCFSVVLFLYGLMASTVALVWQCCHRFLSVCDRSSSIFFFEVVLRLAVHSFSSTDTCWLFCLASVYISIEQQVLRPTVNKHYSDSPVDKLEPPLAGIPKLVCICHKYLQFSVLLSTCTRRWSGNIFKLCSSIAYNRVEARQA